MDETPADSRDAPDAAEFAEPTGRFARLSGWGRTVIERMDAYVEHRRRRSTLIDLGFRMYERDSEAGGTVLGSALALRLFLFFVPLVLLLVGLAGLVGQHLGYSSASSDAGIAGSIGSSIDSAFSQSSSAAWVASLAGLFGMMTTGWSLSRALVVSSALSWRLSGRQKLSVRAVGTVTGLIVGIGLITLILNRIRAAVGVAVASMSFIAVLAIYLVLWLIVYQMLPRGTSDPGSSLPGASIAALTLTGMQAVSVLYLPGAIDRSSELYGAIGVTIATLGWFFIIGRVVVFSFSVNAVIYEQVGSVSELVFAVPGLSFLPRRYPAIARYFDLDHDDDASREAEPIPPPAEARDRFQDG